MVKLSLLVLKCPRLIPGYDEDREVSLEDAKIFSMFINKSCEFTANPENKYKMIRGNRIVRGKLCPMNASDFIDLIDHKTPKKEKRIIVGLFCEMFPQAFEDGGYLNSECEYCQIPTPGSRKCSACAKDGFTFYYCSEKCQKDDWNYHKKICGNIHQPDQDLSKAKKYHTRRLTGTC